MQILMRKVEAGRMTQLVIRVEGDDSRKIYQDATRKITCPKCGEVLVPKDEDLCFQIDDPLQTRFDLHTGKIMTKCQSCGARILTEDEYDLGAFPVVVDFLERLRSAYISRAREARKQNG